MRTEQAAAPAPARRPLSIWILTIFNILFAVILMAAAFKGPAWGLPEGQAIFWGILGLGISLAAQLAWAGSRWGRNILLALLTLYLGLLLVQNLRDIAWAVDWSSDDAYIRREVLRAAFAVLWLAANYWLLLGKRARRFYS